MQWSTQVATLAEQADFAGVIRVDRRGDVEFAAGYGLADRRCGVRCTPEHQFAMASGSKAFTALAIMSLIEDRVLSLSTSARSLLGSDLPLVADDVSVEHLLAHRSGIGDYVDEDLDLDLADYILTVPVHSLDRTEGYVPAMDGRPQKFNPGARFAYSNGGYVLLALLAERAAGASFHELARERVFAPAQMASTEYLRSDELPERAAMGYLDPNGLRTNVLHLPVRGSGDGGAYTTVADVSRFWAAVFAGEIVATPTVQLMLQPHSDAPKHGRRYGFGFWLHAKTDVVMLEGCDAGVSFFSRHDPRSGDTRTVISNTADGAWDIAALFEQHE